MPPFVKERHLTQTSNENSKRNIDNYEISILAMAKKSKLSFEELNLLTLNDFFDYIDLYIGEDDTESTRDATQNDIDNFYSYM